MSTPFWRQVLCVTESLDTSTAESDHGLAEAECPAKAGPYVNDGPAEAGHYVLMREVLARGRAASDMLGSSRRARTPRTCLTRRV